MGDKEGNVKMNKTNEKFENYKKTKSWKQFTEKDGKFADIIRDLKANNLVIEFKKFEKEDSQTVKDILSEANERYVEVLVEKQAEKEEKAIQKAILVEDKKAAIEAIKNSMKILVQCEKERKANLKNHKKMMPKIAKDAFILLRTRRRRRRWLLRRLRRRLRRL